MKMKITLIIMKTIKNNTLLDIIMDTDLDLEPEEKSRSIILDVVEKLDAYIPSPVRDSFWFDRVLNQAKLFDDPKIQRWFPWDIPPIDKMLKLLESPIDEEREDITTLLVELTKDEVFL